jgi:ATP-dependent helicase STH1/SNF2
MDLQRTNAPTLYSDVKDCPDWILYPNGKPEEGSEVVDDGHPETLGKRRAAAGDKVYDDGLTEKQFCRMMDKQALEEDKGKKKRKKKRSRNAVDPSLILEEDGIGRKRAKTKQLEIDNTSKRFNAASSASASGNGEVSAAMNDRLISITRSLIYFKDKSTKRKLSEIFLEKPCPQTYPDYYQVIDKPIGINDILRKCRAKLYATLNDFRDDWNTLFKNALTYNGEGSWIVIDAEALRVELDRLLDKNALSMNAAESKKPVRIKLSLKKSKKKKESNVSEDVSQTESTPPTAAASMKSSESQSELSKSLHSSDESDSNADSNSFIVGMEEREASMQNRSKGRSRGIGSKGGGTRLVRRSR